MFLSINFCKGTLKSPARTVERMKKEAESSFNELSASDY